MRRAARHTHGRRWPIHHSRGLCEPAADVGSTVSISGRAYGSNARSRRLAALTATVVSFGWGGSMGCSGSDHDDVYAGDAILNFELRIDGRSEDLVPIGDDRSVAVSERGVMAVRQSQDDGIRFFDVDGRPLGMVGRRGEGPGEFQSMSRIGWLADTLWVYDLFQQRITLFTPPDRFVRTTATPSITKPRSTERGMIPASTIIYVRWLTSTTSVFAFIDHTPTPAVHLALDGTIQQVVGWEPEVQTHVDTPGGGYVPLPFASRAFEGTSADARRLAFAYASVEGEHAATFLVTVIDAADGDTVLTRRLPFEPVPIPRAVRDSVTRRRQIRNRLVPTTYPPLANLLVGRDGTIWIEMREKDDTRPYVVLASDGELLGTLTLPRTSRVAVAQQDRVWVIERDVDDIESIVRYGVTWRGSEERRPAGR